MTTYTRTSPYPCPHCDAPYLQEASTGVWTCRAQCSATVPVVGKATHEDLADLLLTLLETDRQPASPSSQTWLVQLDAGDDPQSGDWSLTVNHVRLKVSPIVVGKRLTKRGLG